MWTRSLLKMNAKQVLSRHYWLALLVCFVALLLAGGAPTTITPRFTWQFTGHHSWQDYGYGLFPLINWAVTAQFTGFAMLLGIITFCLAVLTDGISTAFFLMLALSLAILVFLFAIFVGMPVCVGKCRYFMESRVGDAPFSTLFSTFGPAYRNVVKVMFFKDLRIGLWSLLLIVPGIYKSYQYRMVDYLLAENPYLTCERALELSRQMTEGEKFNMFLLDLSFFGWLFIGTAVFTIGVYFVHPYMEATYAELYAALRAKIFSMGLTGEDELSGFLRY